MCILGHYFLFKIYNSIYYITSNSEMITILIFFIFVNSSLYKP